MKRCILLLSVLFSGLLVVFSCSNEGPSPSDTGPKSASKQIISFVFNGFKPAIQASIDQNSQTITATVPAYADVSRLIPTIKISDKARISPSSDSVQNFSEPVKYTVMAEDSSLQIYKVQVVKQPIASTNPCLLVRIDSETDPKDFATFEYTSTGLISIIALSYIHRGVYKTDTYKFGYNQDGQLTNWWPENNTSSNEYRFIYSNGMISRGELYKDGKLNNGSIIPDFFTLNQKGQVIKSDTLRLDYTGDNATQIKLYDKKELLNTWQVSYDSKKHFLSASAPQGISSFFYAVSLSDLLWNISTKNNPVKVLTTDGQKMTITHTYNEKDYPIKSVIKNGTSQTTFRYTYSNCQ